MGAHKSIIKTQYGTAKYMEKWQIMKDQECYGSLTYTEVNVDSCLEL